MAIPKKIHYVWVGGKEKPKAIQKCMKTWKKHLKDYEIVEWNETNFDINSHPFVKKAYENRKWAFVSDYIRAYAIYNQGGVYLDTDVLVLDNLDSLLNNRAFVGYERPDFPFTAVFGAEAGHPLVKEMLYYYDGLDMNFEFKDNNTISVSNILIEHYGCMLGNIEQTLREDIKVYPDGILCNPSMESKTVHVFLGSWLNRGKFSSKMHEFLRMKMSNKFNIRLYLGYSKIKKILKSGRKVRVL